MKKLEGGMSSVAQAELSSSSKTAVPSTKPKRMSAISVTINQDATTAIERKIARRLEEADTNHDGQLDRNELTSLVKDLVYEQRSNTRLMFATCMASLLCVQPASNLV